MSKAALRSLVDHQTDIVDVDGIERVTLPKMLAGFSDKEGGQIHGLMEMIQIIHTCILVGIRNDARVLHAKCSLRFVYSAG